MEIQSKKVIEKLLKRKNGEKDDAKIALVLPGGGMRGAFSGGAMIALEELGLADCFDYIYGFSAGAFSGAYLLSGKAKEGTSIYYEDLTKKRFIQPWKITKSLNLDYFCDGVVRKRKPLDIEKIKKSKSVFKIFVTRCSDGEQEFFTPDDDVDLVELLKASCSYPGFYQPYLKIKGGRFLDGNAIRLLPFEELEEDGCTDILVISNVSTDYRESKFDYMHLASLLLIKNLPKKFKKNYKNRIKLFNSDLDNIFGRKISNYEARSFVVSPSYNISPGEDRESVLEKLAVHGYEETIKAFQA